jgi:hypothetical protein
MWNRNVEINEVRKVFQCRPVRFAMVRLFGWHFDVWESTPYYRVFCAGDLFFELQQAFEDK